MGKYLLKKEFEDCQIITKTESGQDVLVNSGNFSDYWAERMLVTGQGHMITINHTFIPDPSEKKTFEQISENVIISTLKRDLIDENQLSETANEQESKPKRGRRPKE